MILVYIFNIINRKKLDIIFNATREREREKRLIMVNNNYDEKTMMIIGRRAVEEEEKERVYHP